MVKKFQVYFIAFPGKEQLFPESDVPMIKGAPWLESPPDNDEYIQDCAMGMADWALNENPRLFGLDENDPEYQGYNDKSIEIAGEIMRTMDGENKLVTEEIENARASWQWVSNIEIVPGVIVRAAYFEYEERR